ncbi:hypothetical protein HMPREF0530_0895 [Lacticaseibacillus paracasei subsp. paracasei ATCC 25302 = DSM 5622 = JCM 8130]|nr:hypothetical protein HMPREF0530_0895 [Lacticaseibacillus paracasei subsp. paracasei ATCC 25302 = DSM 5622 = JCM 8130]
MFKKNGSSKNKRRKIPFFRRIFNFLTIELTKKLKISTLKFKSPQKQLLAVYCV